MGTSEQLKVLALGNTMTIYRLKTCIGSDSFVLTATTDLEDTIIRLQQENFDILIVDSLIEQAASACHYVYTKFNIPIGLIFRETEVNWQNLSTWDVDGFIPEDSTKTELIARIAAISRRKSKFVKS